MNTRKETTAIRVFAVLKYLLELDFVAKGQCLVGETLRKIEYYSQSVSEIFQVLVKSWSKGFLGEAKLVRTPSFYYLKCKFREKLLPKLKLFNKFIKVLHR